jgi:hypothetical protein
MKFLGLFAALFYKKVEQNTILNVKLEQKKLGFMRVPSVLF